jgi:hypothetical protein
MAIMSVVLAGISGLFATTSKYHTAQELMVETTQNVRAAKNLMVSEIRSAGCNPEGGDRLGFEYDSDDKYDTDANSIHFTRDIDNGDGDEHYEPDGDADDDGEDIAYYRVDNSGNILDPDDDTAGTLIRFTDGYAGKVAKYIVALEFKYFDEDNAEINPDTLTSDTNLATIRVVEVRIVGQVKNTARVSENNQLWEQQFRVRVRNLL